MTYTNQPYNNKSFVTIVMQDDHLRTNILYNIDDIKDLTYACSIDKKSQEITS